MRALERLLSNVGSLLLLFKGFINKHAISLLLQMNDY